MICLLKEDSSMDRFLVSKPEQKKTILSEIVNQTKQLYIWGEPGIGKTYTVRETLGTYSELTADILKNKQTTLDFLDMVHGRTVLVDNFEEVMSLPGMSEIRPTDKVIIIGNCEWTNLFNIKIFKFPKKTREELLKICNDPEKVDSCNGDIRSLLQDFSDKKDIFWTVDSFLEGLLCGTGTFDIGDSVDEHGHVLDVIHENYISSGKDLVSISEDLSRACVYDVKIYEGNWNLLPFFSLEACISPVRTIGGSLKAPLRKGSAWSSFLNQCTRRKKLKEFFDRTQLTYDDLFTLREHMLRGSYDILKHYKLTTQDISLLNHIFFVKKLPAKLTNSLKKLL
jgi:hypothetical protein